MLDHVIRYNISLLEYFQFRFFEKTPHEKEEWAGTGFMYEYQLKMNPKAERHILDDKRVFAKKYKEFLVHQVEDTESLKAHPDKAEQLLHNSSCKIVLKAADGKCGAQVLVKKANEYIPQSLIHFLENSEYDLVEAFIIQHERLQSLSPSAVNTIRIFTQLTHENKVELLGCRLRISVNSPVDNMAAGNMAAPIDEQTGIVSGPGVYSDITKPDEHIHPITGVKIEGFQVPYWQESVAMVKRAALKHPQNRSIGWDVVITDQGPGLIEGNHDWCKLLWQLPVKRGLKGELLKYS
ncbi:sugar-transfer associated ATP-grasp domain-containing protein [Shiella aurantiaca]|nr:sugar-transfer associated ATP-grasp domain-containing protein [Shiella aurantiaca]